MSWPRGLGAVTDARCWAKSTNQPLASVDHHDMRHVEDRLGERVGQGFRHEYGPRVGQRGRAQARNGMV
ncbi:MAG: hypothetical protein HND48_13615 [Chloroflexi bacterium]|nr:hypothetical protein [Chloroflexota bacterium]